ncbi:unnamed protein product, partial [Phaeothamnion confervicola]
ASKPDAAAPSARLQGGVVIATEQETVRRGGVAMTVSQLNARVEDVRERLMQEAARLGVTVDGLRRTFWSHVAATGGAGTFGGGNRGGGDMSTLPGSAWTAGAAGAGAMTVAARTMAAVGTMTTGGSAAAGNLAEEREIGRAEFKRRLLTLGFNLTDFPDEALSVLDANDSGTISAAEFVAFFDEGVAVAAAQPPPLPPPEDDRKYQPIDLAGQLFVTVCE